VKRNTATQSASGRSGLAQCSPLFPALAQRHYLRRDTGDARSASANSRTVSDDLRACSAHPRSISDNLRTGSSHPRSISADQCACSTHLRTGSNDLRGVSFRARCQRLAPSNRMKAVSHKLLQQCEQWNMKYYDSSDNFTETREQVVACLMR
jgi:hypothetical protein